MFDFSQADIFIFHSHCLPPRKGKKSRPKHTHLHSNESDGWGKVKKSEYNNAFYRWLGFRVMDKVQPCCKCFALNQNSRMMTSFFSPNRISSCRELFCTR